MVKEHSYHIYYKISYSDEIFKEVSIVGKTTRSGDICGNFNHIPKIVKKPIFSKKKRACLSTYYYKIKNIILRSVKLERNKSVFALLHEGLLHYNICNC